MQLADFGCAHDFDPDTYSYKARSNINLAIKWLAVEVPSTNTLSGL